MKAAIIGYGRFGKLWAELLKDQFDVFVSDAAEERRMDAAAAGFETFSLNTEIEVDVVFFSVPMSDFESALRTFCASQKSLPLIADLLSVKVYPKSICQKLLPAQQKVLLLHPLFGPDAVRELGGVKSLPIMLDQLNLNPAEIEKWTSVFSRMGLRVLQMTCEEHDQKAAWSQGVAHYVGRILERMNVQPTEIDTVGAKKLQEIKDQVCNDTWDLFTDLQTKNPYTREMRVALDRAEQSLLNQLIPNRRFENRLVIGIQGGKGSFNETATLNYLERHAVKDYEIVYLYTSEAVLAELHKGETDRGVFAIHNSIGGVVDESLQAMSKYNFDVVEEFEILITHSLMCRREVGQEQISQIMAHPQVFKQCSGNLKKRYPNLKLISGEGELIDTARAAEELSLGKLPNNFAILGNPKMADIYGLKIIAENLQDLDNNLTSFLLVERRSEVGIK